MSKRTSAASKAVRMAWEKERHLVLEGRGTRDWTPEQQQTIVDKGIAYDDDGRAYEGQHMKSVEAFPEHQDGPGNIQLLTRQEHLEAHRGNWQNPTNWYYDPNTKTFTDFGDGMYVPPEIAELSNPVFNAVPKSGPEDKGEKENAINDQDDVAVEKASDHINPAGGKHEDTEREKKAHAAHSVGKTLRIKQLGQGAVRKIKKGFGVGLRWVLRGGKWVVEHPREVVAIAAAIGAGLIGAEIESRKVGEATRGVDSSEEGSDLDWLKSIIEGNEGSQEGTSSDEEERQDDVSKDDDYSEDTSDLEPEEESSSEGTGTPKKPHKRNGFTRHYKKSGKEGPVRPTIVHPDEYTED